MSVGCGSGVLLGALSSGSDDGCGCGAGVIAGGATAAAATTTKSLHELRICDNNTGCGAGVLAGAIPLELPESSNTGCGAGLVTGGKAAGCDSTGCGLGVQLGGCPASTGCGGGVALGGCHAENTGCGAGVKLGGCDADANTGCGAGATTAAAACLYLNTGCGTGVMAAVCLDPNTACGAGVKAAACQDPNTGCGAGVTAAAAACKDPNTGCGAGVTASACLDPNTGCGAGVKAAACQDPNTGCGAGVKAAGCLDPNTGCGAGVSTGGIGVHLPSSSSTIPIPIISLHLPDDELLSHLHEACRSTGFFYIKDHDVDPILIQQVLQQGIDFFSLSDSTKLSCLFNKWHRGYTPNRYNQMNIKSGDPKEGWYMGPEIEKDDPRFDSTPFHGSNSWPDSSLLPPFRDIMLRYHTTMEKLALRLSSLLFRSIPNTPDLTVVPGHFDNTINALRLICYPPTQTSTTPIYGVGPHTDSGMLTILLTDEHPGLQIRVKQQHGDNETYIWQDIPTQPGCFIVNLADMLQRWTNNYYKSTLHRVVRHPGQPQRISVPFFYDPNYECVVSCLAGCCSPSSPPLYPPVTCGQYIQQEFEKGLFQVTPITRPQQQQQQYDNIQHETQSRFQTQM